MTLIPPNQVAPVVPTGRNFPFGIGRFPNTVPFTYRDASSFSEMFEQWIRWVEQDVVPEVVTNANSLSASYNAASEALAQAMTDYAGEITGDRGEFNEKVEETLASINATQTVIEGVGSAATAARADAILARDTAQTYAAGTVALQNTVVKALAPRPAVTPAIPYSVVVWADSIGEIGNGTDSVVELISQLTNLGGYNGGKWGQSAPQIAARQGGAPANVTFPNNTIPVVGATVVVTTDVNPLGGSYSGARDFYAHNTLGTLTWDQPTNVLTWTSKSAPGLMLKGPVKLVPVDGIKQANREAIQIFIAGRNGAQDVTGNTNAMNAMVGYANARYGIISIMPWAGQVDPANSNYAYIESHPESYWDYVSFSQTTEAANAAGVVFNANDTADIATGLVPRSLRQDDVHPNAAGRRAIAYFAVKMMVANGWVAPYAPPALPVTPTNRWDYTGRGSGALVATINPTNGNIPFTQATVANQPTVVNDPLFNRNVVRVDATHTIGGYLGAVPTAGTISILGKVLDATDANGKLLFNTFGILLRGNGGNYGTYSTTGGAVISTTKALDTAVHVFTLVINGATSILYIDGVQVGTGTVNPTSPQINTGGGTPIEVAQVVYNDSILTGANVASLSAALKAGYLK